MKVKFIQLSDSFYGMYSRDIELYSGVILGQNWVCLSDDVSMIYFFQILFFIKSSLNMLQT